MLVAAAFQPAAAAQLPRRAPVPGSSCRVFPADNVWSMDISKLPVAKQEQDVEDVDACGLDAAAPGLRTARRTVCRSTWSIDSHQKVHVDFGYADESDPGPYPFGTDTHDRGRVRPARADDRPRHLHALRAVRRGLERRPARRPAAARSSTSTARTTPAARGLDVGRRRRAADLPRPRTLGRGARRRDRSRDPLHGRLHAASATSGRRGTRPAARTPSCPPMGARFRLKAGFDGRGFSPRRAGRSSRR